MTKGPSTEAIHRAEGASPTAHPLTTPIYQTTTFLFESAEEVKAYIEGRSDKFLYSRYRNPTVQSTEAKLAALEGAEAALLFGSGMAAVSTALLGLLEAGDEVVCCSAIYGNTMQLLQKLLPRFGITARFEPLEAFTRPEGLIGPATRVVWFESPINPTLRCIDIAPVAEACRLAGVLSIVDSTFASPINQKPLALGADLVMHSATKYLNGHSDVTAGVLAGPAALVGRLEPARRLLGTVLDPQAAWTVARGLKTIAVRVARHNASAQAIAEWLEKDRRVARVLYPGLPSFPDHAVARRQMQGFGGMVSIDLDGGVERASRFFNRLQLFKKAASLGGVESLCSLPIYTSQWGNSDEELARAGVTRGMARLSVGLEDVEDLIADLDQALD
jgi:cystathionine beta-lyase/cystathionine gamma-synthase